MPLYPGLCDPGGSGSGGHLAAADAGHSGYTPVDPSGPSDSYGPPAAASYGPPATSYGLPAASYGPTLGLAAGYGDGQATSVLLDSIAGHPLRPEQPQQQQTGNYGASGPNGKAFIVNNCTQLNEWYCVRSQLTDAHKKDEYVSGNLCSRITANTRNFP